MPALRIQTLGPFRVWRQGQLIPRETWPTYKSLALFKILLTERGHFVPAERLMDYLWPDLSPQRAQNNLWVTISQARRALQPDLPRRARGDYVVTRREGYAFRTDSDYWLDVDEFATQVQTAQGAEQTADRIAAFEAARTLYRGDYLEEDPYQDWAVAARERLRGEYLALLADLAEAYARQGRYRRAISLCYESLATDNADEQVYRRLMLYHYSAGEQHAALKAYDECRRVLRAEIDVEPMPETVDLYRQIQRRRVEVTNLEAVYPAPAQAESLPHSLNRTPFVGRDQEYRRLVTLADEAANRRGNVVLVEGEAGMGKSRLVEESAGIARRLGMGTLSGYCYQVEQTIPYQPLANLVRRVVEGWPAETLRQVPDVWLTEIAALVPEVAGIAPHLPAEPADVDEGRQARLFQALVRLLDALAGDDGLLLCVDDVHWADPATLQFLHHVAHHVAQCRILLVCTYRGEATAISTDLPAFLHGVRRDPRTLHIRLAPLSAKDVTDLLASMGGSPVDGSPMGGSPAQVAQLSRWLYRETAGHPFFLVSILQSLLEQGLLVMGEGVEWQVDPQALEAAGPELALPEALQDAVRDRLRRVPRAMRRVLDLAAVLGQRFEFRLLQVTGREDPDALLDAVEGLVARRLLQEEDGERYGFNHDKIREVVYHELSAARRSLLHRGVAEVLEDQAGGNPGATASILAYHFERAGESARAHRYWLQAGEHALATYAPQQAARHYERVLALAEGPAGRVDAYLGLGRAHFALDDADAAVADLNQGLRLAKDEDPRRARMLYLLADVHFSCYASQTAEAYAREALAAAETVGDPEIMSQSLSLLGQAYSSRGDLDAEFDLIGRALGIARESGNRWREGRTLADRGWLQAQVGAFAQAAVSAERALRLLETTEDQAGVAFAWNVLGRAEGGRGHYGAAFAAFQRSGEVAGEIEHRFLVAQVPNMLGWLHRQLAGYRSALALDREGAEMARQWSKSPPEISALINVAYDLLNLGDPEQALADLEAIQIQIERDVSGFHAWRWRLRVLHGQGLCHLALGRPGEALGLVEQGLVLARSTTSRKYLALNGELRGAVLARLGQVAEARAELGSAVGLADEIEYQPLRWRGRGRLAELYRQIGQEAEAMRLRAEAAGIVRAIAAGLADEGQRTAFLAADGVRTLITP